MQMLFTYPHSNSTPMIIQFVLCFLSQKDNQEYKPFSSALQDGKIARERSTSSGLEFAEHSAISSTASVQRSPLSRDPPSLIKTCSTTIVND
jgi:hypothetical protein